MDMGLDLHSQLIEYLRAIGWALTASIGFSLGVAIAVMIFNKLSKDILDIIQCITFFNFVYIFIFFFFQKIKVTFF